ncbi:MAG: paraslipin [Halobacteriovoraceae bacterium]|jgi:regulator of protease activity HflC (stomatin/prohibitin superfamily)|nr:paraslipin [Halobacteriovoraceae bacterium]MBT5093574.1 paraslipin [Halobacteriovoraceae bacterium]
MSKDNLVFLLIVGALFLYVLAALIRSLRLVPAQTEFIVERFGRYHLTLKAGFHFLIPFVDKVAFTQDLKEHTMDVPPQTCFTKDEIQVEVDGVIYLQVIDSQKASYGITNYQYAAIQLAQTTTRAIIGTLELDRTFEEREAISGKVVSVLDSAAMKWGVRILRFEIKNLVPPESVRQSMEKQVTAERNRRAILEKSVGQKQSLINTSEGQMHELINNSEGEMQKRINEASGKASEILALGEATAESIKKVANAISGPGGKAAVNLELGQKYIRSLTKLKSSRNNVIMGGNLGDMKEMLKGLDIEL